MNDDHVLPHMQKQPRSTHLRNNCFRVAFRQLLRQVIEYYNLSKAIQLSISSSPTSTYKQLQKRSFLYNA